jgi:hypothetical protein
MIFKTDFKLTAEVAPALAYSRCIVYRKQAGGSLFGGIKGTQKRKTRTIDHSMKRARCE